jgi:hypothetical protein
MPTPYAYRREILTGSLTAFKDGCLTALVLEPTRLRLKGQSEATARFVGGFAPSLKEPDDATGGCPEAAPLGPLNFETAKPTPMEADESSKLRYR